MINGYLYPVKNQFSPGIKTAIVSSARCLLRIPAHRCSSQEVLCLSTGHPGPIRGRPRSFPAHREYLRRVTGETAQLLLGIHTVNISTEQQWTAYIVTKP